MEFPFEEAEPPIDDVSLRLTNKIKNLTMTVGSLRNQMQAMEKKISLGLSKILSELEVLRKENASLKTELKIEEDGWLSVIPPTPFTSVEEICAFEIDLQNSTRMQSQLVQEFENIGGDRTNPEKYLRNCWHRFFSKKLAESFCWRGTAEKKSIRNMTLTALMKNTFRKKFPDEHETFDKVAQKHFQYAHDKIVKMMRYQKVKNMAMAKAVEKHKLVKRLQSFSPIN